MPHTTSPCLTLNLTHCLIFFPFCILFTIFAGATREAGEGPAQKPDEALGAAPGRAQQVLKLVSAIGTNAIHASHTAHITHNTLRTRHYTHYTHHMLYCVCHYLILQQSHFFLSCVQINPLHIRSRQLHPAPFLVSPRCHYLVCTRGWSFKRPHHRAAQPGGAQIMPPLYIFTPASCSLNYCVVLSC